MEFALYSDTTCSCIRNFVRNWFFVNNFGVPAPIRTKFYTETETQVGCLPRNVGHPRYNMPEKTLFIESEKSALKQAVHCYWYCIALSMAW